MSDELLVGEYPTPWGSVWAVVSPEDGVVRASGMRSRHDALTRLGAAYAGRAWVEGTWPAVDDAVRAWVAGDADAITRVPGEQDGGEFFQEVWRAMRDIPSGEPASYAELAAMAGRPAAVRAAGTACARNNLAPFVPCHRVVKSGGAVGNYGYGPEVKAALLAHEAG